MVDFVKTYCGYCGKRDIYVKRAKDGKKTYKQNPDFSFHSVAVGQPDGTTKWFCSENKQHEEYIKANSSDGIEGGEWKYQTPHYTKEDMKTIPKPKTLDDVPSTPTQTTIKTQPISPQELAEKFKVDESNPDAQLIKDVVALYRASIIASNDLSTDIAGMDTSTRISTQGFAQSIAASAINLKLAQALNKLIQILEQKK